MIVGCIYKHPNISISEFNSDFLVPFLNKISLEKKEVILLGDYNINLLNCDSDKNTSEFLELMLSYSFLPKIIKPTRITPRTKTLIDNIFFNGLQSNIIAGNIITDISDQLTQFISIRHEGIPDIENCNTNICRRNYNKLNHDKFKEDFNKINWTNLFSVDNIDTAYDSFLDQVEKLIDKHIPIEKISKRKLKQQSKKPWVSNDLLKRIEHKNKLYQRAKVEQDENLKASLEKEVTILQKILKKDIRFEKDKYYQIFFKENKNNLIKVWKNIKNIINLKPKSKSNISCLYIDGKRTYTNHLEIANKFNDHFTTIAAKIEKNIVKTGKKFHDYLINPNKTFSLYPSTSTEVEDYIKNLNIRKAVGPFSLPNRILKEFSKLFSNPISKIFNMSLEFGVFPQKMKITKIVPFFKKEDNLDCNNYRPISLLPNISKIFEKLIHNRLSKFLEENKCLFSKQFGFRNKHSTTHALINLTETIRKALDDDECACGVFLDFQKAFDSVNHKILLKKLEHYGVRGHARKWFTSYLAGRKQYTTVSNIDSQLKDISYGVPQGSVLGTLLLLIYINDLNRAITYSYIRHFADDTNILYRDKSLRKINQRINFDLKNIVKWLRGNRIALNTNKTEIVLFR